MWRSLLFVPTLNARLVEGAPRRDADAIVLDLEAAVPNNRKTEARNALAHIVPELTSANVSVAVRVNLLDAGGQADIATALNTGIDAIVLPMASPESTEQAAAEAGNEVPLVPLIESPRGVINSLAIAEAAPSVAGLGFGVEDYAAGMGAPPTPALLLPAAFQVIQAARAAGCAPLVFADTIADFKNLERYETAARAAQAMGASGGFAIHPGQVSVLNEVFTPSQAEIDTAKAIIEAAEQARHQGHAVTQWNNRMVDAPVEAAARALLARDKRSPKTHP